MSIFVCLGLSSAHATNVHVNPTVTGARSEVTLDINPRNPNNLVAVGHAPAAGFGNLGTFDNLHFISTFYTTDRGQTWTQVGLGTAQDSLPFASDPHYRADPTVTYHERDLSV